MTNIELKRQLIEQITELNDVSLLESLFKIIQEHNQKDNLISNEPSTHKTMQNQKEIRILKDPALNKISFFQNGEKIFPVKIKGNLYEFEDGQVLLV